MHPWIQPSPHTQSTCASTSASSCAQDTQSTCASTIASSRTQDRMVLGPGTLTWRSDYATPISWAAEAGTDPLSRGLARTRWVGKKEGCVILTLLAHILLRLTEDLAGRCILDGCTLQVYIRSSPSLRLYEHQYVHLMHVFSEMLRDGVLIFLLQTAHILHPPSLCRRHPALN